MALKSIEQQDIQCLHRIRSRRDKEKVELVNQICSLLHKYGIIIPQGIKKLKRKIPEILEQESEDLSTFACSLFKELYKQLVEIEIKIKRFDQQIQHLARQSSLCQELQKIPGVDPFTSTVAAIEDATIFKKGRQFAAWL